ncbi:MarR family winged helix-turn-helix transcriptional regulator [Catenulispora rubra]|uniref:MarR family winged helix-turn-helix transcriptional regulator n=1 Tax=Catenulispora rubra TaxID=280293 RepID=UPI001891F7E8|nr:MarR family transcriptional regulator [Catenulispora rubra]
MTDDQAAEPPVAHTAGQPADQATDQHFEDPTGTSLWRPLQLLTAGIDASIAQVYADADIEGVKPTWVMELLRLYLQGPMTITELAESVGRTHSALSQKVAAMRTAGLVRTTPGPDARTKRVTLTAKSRRLAPRLAAEWRATEAALAELEAEIPYPISRAVADVEQALARKSFRDRITERLREDPAWRGE